MYPKYNVIFPNFTPPTYGLFITQLEWSKLIYKESCPICFMQNIGHISLVVLEKILVGWLFWV